jgi:hypothetical protein
VPPEEVAEVAARVALRLDMEAQRIVTLLSGRVGAVTKAVLQDKAVAIAEVFAAAGVEVVVLAAPDSSAEPEAAKAPEPVVTEPASWYAAGDQAQREGNGPAETEEDEEYPEEATSEAEPTSKQWDPNRAWADDEAGDWRALAPRASDFYHGVPGREEDEPYTPEPAASAPAPEDHGAPPFTGELEDPEAAAAASVGVVPPAAPFQVDDGWRFRDMDPELEDEADRLGPRPAEAGPSVFSTSTRWVPSPHDEYGFDPDEVPMVPSSGSAPGVVDEGRMTTAGRGVGARSGTATTFEQLPTAAPKEGPQLRIFLMWALIVSIVLFLLLQFVMADRVSAAPPASAYAAGLAAFRKGEFASAMRAWEPEAEAGNATAQYYLGYMAQNGLGQSWSNARAAGYYRRAAEAGLPEAQLALGDLYLRGMGVEQDEGRGAGLYAMAASTGDPRARFEYGKLLLHGKGVTRDPATALDEFEAAAAGGWEAAADYVAFAREAAAEQAAPQAP